MENENEKCRTHTKSGASARQKAMQTKQTRLLCAVKMNVEEQEQEVAHEGLLYVLEKVGVVDGQLQHPNK